MKNLLSNGEFHYLVIALQLDYGAPVYIQIWDYYQSIWQTSSKETLGKRMM